MADIRLLTFDLDNTLWDVGLVIRHAEAQMQAHLDEHVPEYRHRIAPNAVMEIRRAVVEARPEIAHDVSALREEVLFQGMLRCGYGSREARSHARAAFAAFYEARQQVVFFEHAVESLELLAGTYQLAALTNGNADIGRMGLSRFFSFALNAADVSASKPAPDMFHAALNRAGIAAHRAIHVGDNPVDDIRGASDVGMHTIWVRHPGFTDKADDAAPSEVVEHLCELPDAVRRIHEG